jgi:hypothetical protein
MCGCGVAEADCTVYVEAEDYTDLHNCELTAHETGYTGTGYLDMDNTEDSWFEWTDIEANNAGYELTFRYANGANTRLVAIIVNGFPAGVMTFVPTADWSSWSTASFPVILRQGANTVRVQAINSYGGPNFDALELSASP